MKISLNTILAIFGAVQTVAEVVKSTVSIVKNKKDKEKAPAPSEEDTEAEVTK